MRERSGVRRAFLQHLNTLREYVMSERILLVDDEENILEALGRMLRRSFEIRTATSGMEGLRILNTEPPFAAVVADQMMPGMDGAEFLAQVHAQFPDTVRIMLSGMRDFETSIRAVNEGHVFRFLTKPFPASSLQDVLEMAVEQYRLNLEMAENRKLRDISESTISICSYCNKVRDPEKEPTERKSWERIEQFLARHFGFRFSHCVCPECVDKLYAELEEQKRRSKLIIGDQS